jgi:hypothetical protein
VTDAKPTAHPKPADERRELFRAELVALVSRQIGATGLSPEDAALVMAEEGKAALEALAWLPHAQRSAWEHFTVSAESLRHGRWFPIAGFAALFPGAGASHDTRH